MAISIRKIGPNQKFSTFVFGKNNVILPQNSSHFASVNDNTSVYLPNGKFDDALCIVESFSPSVRDNITLSTNVVYNGSPIFNTGLRENWNLYFNSMSSILSNIYAFRDTWISGIGGGYALNDIVRYQDTTSLEWGLYRVFDISAGDWITDPISRADTWEKELGTIDLIMSFNTPFDKQNIIQHQFNVFDSQKSNSLISPVDLLDAFHIEIASGALHKIPINSGNLEVSITTSSVCGFNFISTSFDDDFASNSPGVALISTYRP